MENDDESEKWLKVPDERFRESYTISNKGRIKNSKGEIKTLHTSGPGYPNVRLDTGKNGYRKTYDIHVLEAKAFFGEKESKDIIVNHKDGDKTNNNLENLEYITYKDNSKHARENGLLNKPKKQVKHDISKLDTKDIPGFSKYCIDREGNIYNKETKNKISTFADINGNGYIRIALTPNGQTETQKYYLHRIISLVFIPNPNNLPFVNHINENKRDNRIENLEWCTQSDNMKHSAKMKELSRKVQVYDLDGELLETFDSVKEAAEKTGANHTQIIHVCAGRRKTAGEFKWKYANI